MLLDSIAEVATEPPLLDPDDPASQSQTNTWWLNSDPEERATLSVQQVTAAFDHTAHTLRRRIGDLGFRGTATFYVWHDEQAGQLRCSTSTQPPDDLPFRGAYTATDTLDPIVAQFLNDDTPGRIPWHDLKSEPAATGLAEDDPIPPAFLVWTCEIGQRT